MAVEVVLPLETCCCRGGRGYRDHRNWDLNLEVVDEEPSQQDDGFSLILSCSVPGPSASWSVWHGDVCEYE